MNETNNINVEEFLDSLTNLGIKFNLNDGNLVINAPKGIINDELREKISNNKPLIIKYLEKNISSNIVDSSIKKINRDEKIPLSYSQQRLWFLYLLNPKTTIYNIPAIFSIKGSLDIDSMQKAVNDIIRRHESLRTNFYFENGQSYQKVSKELQLKLEVKNIDLYENSKNYIDNNINEPFNLTNDVLIRVKLLYIKETNEYIFILVIHHIISDAWSCGIFANELSELYNSYLEKRENTLKQLDIQYIDYSYWQKEELNKEESKKQLDFWKEKLKNSNTNLSFPLDKKRPSTQTFNGNTINRNISYELKESLKELAKKYSTTMFVVLMSAFHAILYKYTGEEDFNVGFPISGRNNKKIENLIGFFVNTLIIRSNLNKETTFNELLKQINQTTIDALSNQDIPFEKIVESLNVDRNTSYTPLFQFMFVMQNIEFKEPEFKDLEFKLIDNDNKTSKFDLTLTIKDDNSTLSIEYRTDLFEKDTIERFLNHYENLLESIVKNPNEKVSSLSILKKDEFNDLINRFKAKQSFSTNNLLIHQLVENEAEKNPDKIALSFENEEITYFELNRKSNQLANYLIKNGVVHNSKVAICTDISVDMIVSLISILKAGSCYIPIDIEIPRERLDFILNDCNPSFIITKDEYISLFNENNKLIKLNEIDISNELIENPNLNISENSYAYIIYTSGSTGKPNGVIISHKNVIRLFKSANNIFKFDNNDTWVLFHSYAFDYSVWEIWGSFYWGSKLLIVSKELTRNPELFYKEICEQKVTILNQTPSAFQNFSKQAIKSNEKNYLKYILIAGENLDIQTLKDWYSTFPDNSPKLFNCYGITETTVFVTIQELNKNLLNSVSRSPIGISLNDLDLFILDENKVPVPLGVAGELYVGGSGVAISYLNRDELNKERFLNTIENIELSSKVYKSGDRVRALNNGSLEFLGRLDNQVKIRGFRIELGEIESILNSYNLIEESLVILEESNKDKYLNAYITTKDNIDIDIQEIKIFLKSKVNNVMIPRNIIKLDSFPLNNNGKIDKKSLPKPNNDFISEQKNIIKPENETQKIILNILNDLLNIKNIDINDNFFDIGAHSLLMVEAHNKIQEKLNISLDLIDLFNYPSIRSLSEFLSGKKEKKIIKKFDKKIEHDDIAIIGMAGKFPDAEDIEKFWKNLENGIESVHFFSDEELKNKGISQELLDNPNYVKANCLINDIELFDADFWGYSPREAEILDPQHRLFLDCAYHALEHSGYNPDSIKEPVSIFAGTGLSRYMVFNLANNQNIIDKVGYFQLMIANDKDYLSTRTSYKLNLKGSSVTLQTACSTSLVAVHSACQNLLNGESYMALAGGVSIDTQQAGYLYQEGSIASPDGHCRAFSDDAKGIIGGSGAGIVVLKRLKDAIKDNDSIYSIIKSTAINNDGSDKIGFLAPSVNGESDVIIEAIEKAGIKPQELSYIETHGTGTPLGDPIEISALNKAFDLYLDNNEHTNIAIGSVKTNIGHLDTASGIAGLIKTVQALRYKKIPASLNFNKKNPNINFNSNMYVNTELKEWKSDSIRYAGVSSFGVGGTNAHAILSEYKEEDLKYIKSIESNKLFIFSAKSKKSLENMIINFKHYLNTNKEINLDNASYTLKVGRKEFNNRYSFVADSVENAIKELDNFREIDNKKIDKIVFMFSGVGSQYFKMSKNLYENEIVFRENIDICSDILKPLVDLDIRDIIYKQENQEFINSSKYMPLCLFAVEYSLSKLWLSKGIKPDILIGHSFGEYVASCIADSISLEDSLKLILNRSSLFDKIKGSMMAVSTSKENLDKYLKNDLSISAINGENLFLVSGTVESIKQLQLELKENKIASTILEVSAPTHSELLKPIMEDFKPILDCIKWNKPNIPIISNLTSDFVEEYDSEYWLNHMIKPVKFFDSINKLGTEDNILLIEIGAGNQLTSIIKRQSKSNLITINSLPIKNSSENDHKFFLNSLGKIWQYGIKIDWSKEKKCKKIALPLYPFNKRRYWVDSDSLVQNSANDFNKWFYIPSWKRIYNNTYIEDIENVLLITNNQDFYNQIYSNISNTSLATNNFSIKSHENNIYYIAKDDTYSDLFKELEQNNDLPDNIILDVTDSQFFSDNYFKGEVFENFDNIINLVKVLNNYNKKFSITIIINDLYKITGAERINPHKSLVIGPAKVINQEYKNITCKIIDIDKESSIKNIVNELNSHESLIFYRNNYKWSQNFDKIQLNKNSENNYLKEKGIYLITGGLGGIGLSIAEFLSKEYQANLILINRFTDPLDDLSLSSKLVELENLGSEIILKKANVINYSTLEKAFIEALEKFGRIDGIIHTAGLVGDKLIFQRNIDDNSVLDTKIQATKNLARLAEKFNCKFLFLCSSLNSILGGVGQVEYTSANAFLDSFSELYQNSDLKVISTNWGAWKNTGMAERNNKNLPESLRNSNESMSTEQGIEAFKLIMNSNLNQIIVSPIELDKLKEKYDNLSLSKGKQLLEKISESIKVNLYSRPELNNQYVEPQTELEKNICEIWQETLGIEKVGITDNFFELGGDSLNLASIKLKIESKLNIELPMNIIFQGSTIKDLVKFLDTYLFKDIKDIEEIKDDKVLIEENNTLLDINEQDEKLIVALKTTGNKTPFFCIHAISGTSFPFTELAKNFEKEHPFYAIQAQGLSGNKTPISDLKEMASLYIKEIKKIQSQGSYIIGGWSFGAIVALEIAQQLKSNGDDVEKLIIIDMQAPSIDESENLSQMELKQDELKEIFFNDMKKLFGDNVDIENPDIARLFKIFQSNIQASKTYIANDYSGKVELFKASEGIFKETGANYLRWSEISESVNIYNIKGDHYTILKSEEFFNKLNSIIDL